MHELSIAESILNRIHEESVRRGARIIAVGVRIGELSGVDPDALSFGFEVPSKDTPLEGVMLEIDFRKRKQRCNSCGGEFETDVMLTTCPACGNPETVCIAGDELDIAYIELEDAACASPSKKRS
jgi:hydrogenase nickel incorporation protein HypA/HybF